MALINQTSIGTWLLLSGMVDEWWQSAPGKIAAPPTLNWESGGKKCSCLSIKYGISVHDHAEGSNGLYACYVSYVIKCVFHKGNLFFILNILCYVTVPDFYLPHKLLKFLLLHNTLN